MKDKNTAGIYALLLGSFGVHRFYLGSPVTGLIYLFFCWTFIPAMLGVIEGIQLLSMSKEAFDAKYNGLLLAPPVPSAQNIVVNVQNALPGAGVAPAVDPLEQIRRLHELKVAGALTEEEFATEKARLLDRMRQPPKLLP
jgi:TM2 domain-containing membrane protein YozV